MTGTRHQIRRNRGTERVRPVEGSLGDVKRIELEEDVPRCRGLVVGWRAAGGAAKLVAGGVLSSLAYGTWGLVKQRVSALGILRVIVNGFNSGIS